jgi:hypothetical protein
VTKQACLYHAHMRRLPAQDNIVVDIKLSVVFSIFDPRDFVYRLGAMRSVGACSIPGLLFDHPPMRVCGPDPSPSPSSRPPGTSTTAFSRATYTHTQTSVSACRFDEFMKAALQEALRRLIINTPHHSVLDLSAKFQDVVLTHLKEKVRLLAGHCHGVLLCSYCTCPPSTKFSGPGCG